VVRTTVSTSSIMSARRRHHHHRNHSSISSSSSQQEHQPRNRSPPPSSFSKRDVAAQTVVRKIRQITSLADHAELEKHYSFLPSSSSSTNDDPKTSTCWQDRMVQHYHSHLHKEYVLADLTRPGQVGMRWRTETEVQRGRGHLTCGNKHCPSQEQQVSNDQDDETLRQYLASNEPTEERDELGLLTNLPHGSGLHDYEVPFTYREHVESKTELVKLRLCLRCAPLLFCKKNASSSALKARQARYKLLLDSDSTLEAATLQDSKRLSCSSDSSITNSDVEERRRRHRKRKKKRRKNKA